MDEYESMLRPSRSGHFLRTLRSNNPFSASDDLDGFFGAGVEGDIGGGASGEVDALLKRGKVTSHFLRFQSSNIN